ncbi:hypothetical protein QCA50_001002 [Cerrena zonata]|uniref:Uncharacterized protein n=1 Tax=Cerrena zonata TaxID=2478898 RepID=A0AAW0GYX1_9APHY
MHPLGEYARFSFLVNEKSSKLHTLDQSECFSGSSRLSCFAADAKGDDVYGVQVDFAKGYKKSDSVAILIREHCGNHTAFHGTIIRKACSGRLARKYNGDPLRLAHLSGYQHSTMCKINSFHDNIIMDAVKLEIMLVPVDILERTGKNRPLRFRPENVRGISGDIETIEGRQGKSEDGSVRVRWKGNIREPMARAQVFISLKDYIPSKALYLCTCHGSASPEAASQPPEHNDGAAIEHENGPPTTPSTAPAYTASSEGSNTLSNTNTSQVKEEQDDNALKRKLSDPVQQPTSTSKYRFLNNGSREPQSLHRTTMNDQTNKNKQIKQEHDNSPRAVSHSKASGSRSVVKDEPVEGSLPIIPPTAEDQENTDIVNRRML